MLARANREKKGYRIVSGYSTELAARVLISRRCWSIVTISVCKVVLRVGNGWKIIVPSTI